MKKKFAHKPIEIIAFELTDNFEEITKMIDNLNEHFGMEQSILLPVKNLMIYTNR